MSVGTAQARVEALGRWGRFEAPSGVSVEERRDGRESPTIELRAPDGSLVVEYRPVEGVCRIHAARVEVDAERDLELRAGERVRVTAARGVVLASGESELTLDGNGAAVRADELRLEARSATWTGETLRLAGDIVETKARRLVQRAGELETHARRIVERARESFRDVEQLAQTKAGRLRLVAETTLHALGRRALFKAREDLRVRGERIYLE